MADGWPVGYLQSMEELSSCLPKTNPASGREEDLNPGPPDYKSSALTTRTLLPPQTGNLTVVSDYTSDLACDNIIYLFKGTIFSYF